ncbi:MULTISPECIES: hypothetical protein [Streptomyces]|uniref:hypothetical protein n=1 Tax=Streptomyces TaxID=1883 RepID=UPI00167C341A|nr:MULTISPECIES: hypothetical protein [Streptomyces]MBK3527032.1 hypothetical protein [Streptomyces sp. MBT70]
MSDPAGWAERPAPCTSGIRLHDVNHQVFLIRFNELNLNATTRSDGRHTTETVGWIAGTV